VCRISNVFFNNLYIYVMRREISAFPMYLSLLFVKDGSFTEQVSHTADDFESCLHFRALE
jgi:hypothetical protein